MPDTIEPAATTRKSSPVHSPQTSLHPRLAETLARHQANTDQTPIAAYSHALWPRITEFAAGYEFLVLDLGCGCGESTHNLARMHPHAAVLGVDRSSVRLHKVPRFAPNNSLILRADQFDVLRLMQLHGMRALKIYLLYPNPSPKPEQLKRRWHAHPIWPTLLACTDQLELRTNWAIYAEEFAFALQTQAWALTHKPLLVDAGQAALSLFEAKYADSGHVLWQVLAART